MQYHGEATCTQCDRPAYYLTTNTALPEPRCGYHSRKPNRRTLPKNPATLLAKEQAKANRIAAVEEAAARNAAEGLQGTVTLRRFHQAEPFEPTPGSAIIWPNHSRPRLAVDLWCPTLSPKSLGPVKLHHPEPEALTIEALMQAARVFEFELDENGNPNKEFYERRNEAYADPFRSTWRHPFGPTKASHQAALHTLGQPPDAPIAYTVHSAPNGEELHLSYVESRIYYCEAMERLAPQTEAFAALQEMQQAGVNLELCGWDARTWNPSAEEHAAAYLDTRYPYGHETVLHALLTLNSEDYPWRNHETEER